MKARANQAQNKTTKAKRTKQNTLKRIETRARELEQHDRMRAVAEHHEPIAKKRHRRYQIIALHEQGKSMSEIAKIFGITKQAVHGHIKRHRNPSKNERKMRNNDIYIRSQNPHLKHYYQDSVNS